MWTDLVTCIRTLLTPVQSNLIASGFPLHASPLECVSQSRDRNAAVLLATGAHAEVRIWKATSGKPASPSHYFTRTAYHSPIDALSLIQTLPNPLPIIRSPDQCIIVTSLHWAHTHFANALIASYLYHGIV